MMDFVHGMYQQWCELCAIDAQIAFAKKHIDDLEKLEKKRKRILKKYV